MKLEVEVHLRRPAGFALDVAFACEAAALGVVGPSGAGKTTLLEVLAGIEPGRVVIDGRDLSALPLEHRNVGYVMQDAPLFPHLTVRENLAYGPRAEHVEEAARALGIAHLLAARPRTLSGGERRRTALARALANRPALLLLDEPFAGLDERRRREAMSLLDSVHHNFQVPIVLVSHVTEEIVGLTDWAVRLEGGRAVALGSSTALLRPGETQIDSYFEAEVIGRGRVRVGDVELAASHPFEGGRVRMACYAHDVMLARERPQGISARNSLRARIDSVVAAGDVALVTLNRPPLRALVTPEAVDQLDLRPGEIVTAIIKATALTCLGASD